MSPSCSRGAAKRAALILSAVVALAAGLSAHPAAAAGYVPGIDVSHWQGSIDWARVFSAGMRFTFAKATEGQTYTDPTYSTNRAGAEGAGLVFGAYHFGRPDTSTNDAVLEADHFVSTAAPRKGEINPVLDLEVSGGLAVTDLQAWVWKWLQEVRARIGERPIIYTSPSFWKTYMGDTTLFADHGYTLLWIANWNVPSPSVPGGNWGGHGWTFWQWTDCGTVSGITGCVDQDYYHSHSLAEMTIG